MERQEQPRRAAVRVAVAPGFSPAFPLELGSASMERPVTDVLREALGRGVPADSRSASMTASLLTSPGLVSYEYASVVHPGTVTLSELLEGARSDGPAVGHGEMGDRSEEVSGVVQVPGVIRIMKAQVGGS